MLKELGEINKQVEIDFLNKNKKNIPRTALRYAVEKFSKDEKEYFLKK